MPKTSIRSAVWETVRQSENHIFLNPQTDVWTSVICLHAATRLADKLFEPQNILPDKVNLHMWQANKPKGATMCQHLKMPPMVFHARDPKEGLKWCKLAYKQALLGSVCVSTTPLRKTPQTCPFRPTRNKCRREKQNDFKDLAVWEASS